MSLLAETPRASPSRKRRPPAGRRALNAVVVASSLLLAALIVLHNWVPDVGGLGLLVDSAAPWLGVFIPVLIVLAVFARRGRPWVAVLVPIAAWGLVFGAAIVPLKWTAPAASANTLTVASQNIEASSGTGAASAADLVATGAQVVAIQEMDASSSAEVSSVLDATYEYSYQVGTVGLWSSYPILNAQPWDLGLGWQRALAADLETPEGLVSIYVIHAASARIGDHADRDEMLKNLADVLPNDENDRVIAVGDFNAASTDRAFKPILSQLDEPNQSDGLFGFTWPATPFPLARLDHFLQRGLDVTSNTVVPAGGSDHLAIVATVNL
ncbi:endonuclease/exonuclease/phosphatase family protein [Agreia sp. PsM10]|uniref:endonuclease/exonuclease/phosphatase family protein n=1 Tax=Agreia sp. PsM10 TaxID=3030533 RepID=UPI00263B8F4A|nr:endonuclease/exonuclease/phosphatase family protein [Agreia sp. PsM10]MDN4640274.1 endonuclease/exonuclease/phosphatase family protein [Agreia sp. PsM10]